MSVDWERFRKCPVCFAALGRPCTALQGSVVQGLRVTVASDIVRVGPHSRRELRTGYGR